MEAEIPIDHDLIEQLARAILAQLTTLTGTRATGKLLVVNETGDDVVLAKNSYVLPVVGSEGAELGELRRDLVFKVAPNAATLEEHGVGGNWTIPANDELEVDIQSNVGGAQHNLPVDTIFQWDPPFGDLPARCSLSVATTGGAPPSASSRVGVARVAYFEDLNAAALERDLQSARVALPGILLTWESSSPAEGRSAGINQGGTRLAAGKRLFMEAFRLFVVTGTQEGDIARRGQGLRILQAVTRLLTDVATTDDFERLASNGSLEITARNRFSRDERHYVYSLAFRLQRVVSFTESRTFTPWLKTHLVGNLRDDDPDPDAQIELVDVVDPMPPGPPP